MSSAEYKKKYYDSVIFRVKKGVRDEYNAKAATLGMSLSQLIQRGVESYGEGVQDVAPVKPASIAPQLTGEQRKILDAVESLPPDARRALMKFLHALQAEKGGEKVPVD